MYYGDGVYYGDGSFFGVLVGQSSRTVFINMGADERILGDNVTLLRPFARIGEYGYVLEVETDFDATDFQGATFHFRDPDGVVTTQVAESGTPSGGSFFWTVEDGFFDQVGTWEVLLEVDMGSGGIRKSDVRPFRIGESGE